MRAECTQTKKDFVSGKMPFSEFSRAFTEYWPKFLAHHNDAKWHDDDFVSMRSKLPSRYVLSEAPCSEVCTTPLSPSLLRNVVIDRDRLCRELLARASI